MGIDPETLRPGDVFLARHVVDAIGLVTFKGHSWVPADFDIVSVEPRPIQVGDMVKWHGRDGHRVLWLDGDQAWIVDTEGLRTTANLANLQHAPHDASTGEG